MNEPEQRPTRQSIIEGTLAQALGGGVSIMIVTGLASFDIYMKAGFETAFGTVLGIAFYIKFKTLRRK